MLKKLNLQKKDYIKLGVSITILSFIILLLSPFFVSFALHQDNKSNIYSSLENIPETDTALVLGAGITPDNKPSAILYHRIKAGVDLYKAGKVDNIIMSGDNSREEYNEPGVMKDTAIKMGVPAEDIQPDYAGFRTYDSCWRAKNIFEQEKITVVTQTFHINRSVFLCESVGIETYGYEALTYTEDSKLWSYYALRDKVALMNSLVDVYVREPGVVGGEKIDIEKNASR